MKALVLAGGVLLAGCSFGNGTLCGPQTPQVYCDPEAYERLLHPGPYGAHWVRAGMTRQGRLSDFVECGGHPALREGYDIQPNQPVADFFKGYNAHVTQLAACMRGKGYAYLEHCDAQCLYP